MNIRNTDTINGRDPARQMGLWVLYVLMILISFIAAREIQVQLVSWGFGEGAGKKFEPYSLPFAFLLIGGLLATFHKNFWVNPTGNKVQPTINMVNPIELDEDGGTLFTVYTAGFALKWPWERFSGKEVDIEREEIYPTEEYTVTVKHTAIVIKMLIAWKPHAQFLSSYLQNGDGVLKQVAAKAQQYVEEETSDYESADDVRKNQTNICSSVQERLQVWADYLGIKVFDISFAKCDYDSKTQERLNKHIETRVVAEIAKDLVDKTGLTPEKAGELAAIMAGIKGIEIKRNVFEVVATSEVAEAIQNMAPALQALLVAQTTKKQ